MNKIIETFLSLWIFWWVWLNTVGRIEGSLSRMGIFVFDGIAALLGVVVFSFLASPKKQEPRPPTSAFKFDVWMIPALIALGSAVFYCAVTLPIDWDGLDYHLPPLLEAVQNQRWGALSNEYYAVTAYPKLVESLYLWWILNFGHHGYMLLGLLPLVFGAFVFIDLARRHRLNPSWLVALWMTLPLVVKQSSSLYIDNFIAFFGILAFLALERRSAWAFGLAIAMFLGAKFSTLIPAAILILVWLATVRKIPWFAFFMAFLTVGGTTIPNLIQYSNPLYPFRIELFGKAVFPGPFTLGKFVSGMAYYDRPWYERFGRTLFTTEPIPNWDMIQGGLGLTLAALLVIGIVVVFVRWAKTWRLEGATFAIGAATAKGLWMFRYHLWLAGGFILWAARALETMPRKLRALFWILLLIQSLWLWTDRVWFLGLKDEYQSAIAQKDFARIANLLKERAQELFKYGEPQKANNNWDQWRIQARKVKDQTLYVCRERPDADLRGPWMVAALYGADFSNTVVWDEKLLPKPGKCENGIWTRIIP